MILMLLSVYQNRYHPALTAMPQAKHYALGESLRSSGDWDHSRYWQNFALSLTTQAPGRVTGCSALLGTEGYFWILNAGTVEVVPLSSESCLRAPQPKELAHSRGTPQPETG